METWKNRIVEVADLPVKDLLANPRNWRKHPKSQQKALLAVLGDVGWIDHVTFNRRTGRLIDGHLRVLLAEKHHEETVPVTIVDLSEEEEAIAIATFDPIGAMAEADREVLVDLLGSIDTENEQIRGLLDAVAKDHHIALDSTEDDDAPEPEIDRAAELREHWQTEPGQLWQLGRHRVICGDSSDPATIDRLMRDTRAAACITDPPYGTASKDKIQRHGTKMRTFDLEWDKVAPLTWIPEAVRALEAGAALVSFWENARLTNLWNAFDRYGVHPLNTLYWKKAINPQPRKNFCTAIESAVFGRTPGKVHCWNGGGATSNVFETPVARGNERTAHPTQKPIALIAWLVELLTPEDAFVFDPFLGSGTTLIACEQLGRRAAGCEISPEYTAVILQRWHDLTGETPELLEER
jgi:DNA modification methylase